MTELTQRAAARGDQHSFDREWWQHEANFRARDLGLRGEGGTRKVSGRPLTRVEMERLVAYARRCGFLPPADD
jgi:hypothetical protein